MGGRRRKRYKKVVKLVRRIPKVFRCPNCDSVSLTISFEEGPEAAGDKEAHIRCGNCGLYAVLFVPLSYEPVDAYSKFVDAFISGSISVKYERTLSEEE
ncbi:MAG: hypothetical protein QW369_03980 [Desulfurococcaceae archaeon]